MSLFEESLKASLTYSQSADVKISHQSPSKQFIHQTKVLNKLYKNIKKIYGLPYGYELITQNTFQNNACFTIFGQFHNGGSNKTNANPNPTKDPNTSPNRIPNPPKTATLPRTLTLTLSKPLTLSQTLTLEAYNGEIP